MSFPDEQLHSLLMQAPARIAITRGPDHVFEFANVRYVEFLEGKDIIGRPARDVFPVAVAQGIVQLADQVYATGEPYVGIEAPYWADFNRDGFLEERFFNVVLQAVRGCDGAIEGVMIFSLDVTPQVRARQEVERRQRDFIAGVAHDLKSPLTTIKASSQMLKRRILQPEPVPPISVVDVLDRIDAVATRMAASIDQLLDATRAEADAAVPLSRQRLDLVDLVRQLAEEQQHATDRHRIVVQASAATVWGLWDRVRLQRAIGNILSNAVKFSPAGGDITICITSEAPVTAEENTTGGAAILSIDDQGLGIPAADLPRIFERGHRAANVIHEIEGTGLGLTSALSTIQEHGGTISVSSSEGHGATFNISLPLSVPADQTASSPAPRTVRATEQVRR